MEQKDDEETQRKVDFENDINGHINASFHMVPVHISLRDYKLLD